MSDPNELLKRIREIARNVEGDIIRDEITVSDMVEALEEFLELDKWLSAPKNGFLPIAWRETTDRYADALRQIRDRTGCHHFGGPEEGEPEDCKDAGFFDDPEMTPCDACIAKSVLPPVSDDP